MTPSPHALPIIGVIGSLGSARGGAATATARATAAAVSQELWNLGGALVQRAQEPNIPCGESLTSTNLDLYSCRPESDKHELVSKICFAGFPGLNDTTWDKAKRNTELNLINVPSIEKTPG